jgi:hypothetical protein
MLRAAFRAASRGLDIGWVRATGGAGSQVGMVRLPRVAGRVCLSLNLEIMSVPIVIVFIYRSGLNTRRGCFLFQRIAFHVPCPFRDATCDEVYL